MNQLGYQLLNRGKTADAIEVFKLNVREFPKSSNVYDSLGEAYAKAGNRDLALQNYKRSIELDPGNTNAPDAIKRLTIGEEKIDARLLDDYVGKYDSPLGVLNITRDGDKLFATPEGNTKEELVAKSPTKFQVPTVGAEVEFVRDELGHVGKMLIRIGGQQMEARRIK
jgi:tetratricopeptide (TPR) repeat protein